jgi:hypothetical protein
LSAEVDIEKAYNEFWEDIFVEADLSGSSQLEAFFKLFSAAAAEAGECTDLTYTPAKKEGRGGYQIDGFALEKETEELYVAISDFRTGSNEALNSSQIETFLNRAKAFLELAVTSEFIEGIEETSPAFEAAYPVFENLSAIRRIRILIFSNARVSIRKPPAQSDAIVGKPVVFSVLDFTRFDALKRSLGQVEPIEIDVVELSGLPLPSLEVHTKDGGYSAYLVAIPGSLLASIYGLYGARLLEQNVRTFLQAKTKVNRGIIETAASVPEMFFAYNNGITATASQIETILLDNGACGITSIRNLQIVNGGQTTASILYAKDRSGADVSQILIPMKLSVVSPERIDEIVPKISRFANTQNKVSDADFFSSHAFHVKMEQISRRLMAPAKPGFLAGSKWFYERARGQYKDQLSYGTPATRKKFEHEFPKDQLIQKTELAKYELTFACQPHVVSLGEQKCFVEFTGQIGKAWELDNASFNEEWFKKAVARAIVFRWTDRMVANSDWYKSDRGYKAQIVTYTIAWLVSRLNREHRIEISLDMIWNAQGVSEELGSILRQLASQVAKTINDTPENVKNVGEYCKRIACWTAVDQSLFKLTNMNAPEIRGITARSQEASDTSTGTDERRQNKKIFEDEMQKDDKILSIRQLFQGASTKSRDEIVTELARMSGYSRTGPRIREEMENTIRTAVRRGILRSSGKDLQINASSIADFEKDFLKEQFLASMRGRGWVERDDSVRAFARWLGYRRTGPGIDDAARSLINGLIRQSRLDSDGSRIRRAG